MHEMAVGALTFTFRIFVPSINGGVLLLSGALLAGLILVIIGLLRVNSIGLGLCMGFASSFNCYMHITKQGSQ